jgi:transcriptional regulator with XRE-family HTH domain
MSSHDPIYRSFVRNLRGAREAAGLSQSAVAKMIGQPQSFIAKVEAGDRRLDVAEAMRLAAVLGYTLEELLPKIPIVDLAAQTPSGQEIS